MRCPDVGASVRIAHRVRELVLDDIRPEAQHFVQDRPRHSAKSVAAHFVLGDSHATHGTKDGVVAHRPLAAAGAGENISATAGERLQFAQDCNRLRRERNDVWRVRLGDRVASFAAIQVHCRPLGMPQLAGAYEYERRKA